MKNHFIFSYSGNKRNEVQNLYYYLDLNNISTIIETNCGTSALSYYLHTLHPNKFKYVLNDNSTVLMELYKILMDVDLSTKLNGEINKLIDTFNTFEDEKERQIWWNNLRKIHTNSNIYIFIFIQKYGQLQGKKHPTFKRILKIKPFNCDDYKITHFLRTENVEIVLGNDIDICKKYKDHEDVLIFLDPPYLNTSNGEYSDYILNIYEYIYNNNINDWKANTYLILENIWIIRLLFKDNFMTEPYDKMYEGSKKKTNHIIISNRDLNLNKITFKFN